MLDVNVSLIHSNDTKSTLLSACDKDIKGVAMIDKKGDKNKKSIDVGLRSIDKHCRISLVNAEQLES